jgi:ribonuclease P protein component
MEKKFSFGKKWLIREEKEIEKVYSEGSFYGGEFINVHYLPDKEKRFSIRLERGIKGGINRNRLRRRLREIVRIANPSLKEGFYVIKGRKSALMEDYNKIKDDFDRLCLKGNLWLK